MGTGSLYLFVTSILGICVLIDSNSLVSNPLCRYLSPKSPCPDNITYYVYTRETVYKPQKLTSENIDEVFAHKPCRKLIVLIHGWTETNNSRMNEQLRSAYLCTKDYRIISIDWSIYAEFPCLITASYNVEAVGLCIGKFIKKLIDKYDCLKIHIIGFSLGAHIAGYIGRYCNSLQISRITGLEPGGILYGPFEKIFQLKSVSKKDGCFVDLYHSNSGVLGRYDVSLGHVNVVFNNGIFQPGCVEPVCSHYICSEFYAESIFLPEEKNYWGVECFNRIRTWFPFLAFIGRPKHYLLLEPVDKKLRGTFCIKTNASPNPYYSKGKPEKI